jgi:hypothetical protein
VRLRLPNALSLHVVGAHSSQCSLHLLFASCFGYERQKIRLGCNTVTAAAAMLSHDTWDKMSQPSLPKHQRVVSRNGLGSSWVSLSSNK